MEKFAIALTICSALILAEVAALPKQSEKAEIEAVIHDVVHINPRGTNYSETVDMIYDTSNVWIMERPGGAVDMHDFNTGLHYVRANEAASCYVYPTGHKFEEGTKLLNSLKDGLRVLADVDIGLAAPLSENLIPDASFAPKEAAKYCDRYQWSYIDHYVISVKDSRRLMSSDKRIKRGVVGYQALAGTVCPH